MQESLYLKSSIFILIWPYYVRFVRFILKNAGNNGNDCHFVALLCISMKNKQFFRNGIVSSHKHSMMKFFVIWFNCEITKALLVSKNKIIVLTKKNVKHQRKSFQTDSKIQTNKHTSKKHVCIGRLLHWYYFVV